jgi:hypothetical protein
MRQGKQMRFKRIVVAAGLLGGLTACGGSSDDTGGGTAAGGDTASGGEVTGGDADTPVPTCDPASAEDFAVVFGQAMRFPAGDDSNLFMMRPVQGYTPVQLTKFTMEKDGADCQLGCEIDEGLDWITASTEQTAGTGGYTMQFGRFNGCLEVALSKGNKFPGIWHLEFAGGFLYYSEKLPGCVGQSCQYQVTRVDLSKPAEKAVIIPAFPPDDDKDWIRGDTTYSGVFHVSPNGDAVVLLSPTIRSQRVYLWTKGTLHEVDYLCDNLQNESCIGAGSRYDDEDPVAISPDSKTVVLFTVHKSALRVRRYSTENPLEVGTSSILNVTQAVGDYEQTACAVREPWQPTNVISRPVFTPDGSRLLFIGTDACAGGQKLMTNIYAIDPAWIGDLTPVDEGELVNLTKNPGGDVAANREIGSFTISPDGKRILFSATPEVGQNFEPFPAGSDARQLDDTELYKMSICGGDAQQLTNNVAYTATRPRLVPLPDPAGCGVYPLPEAKK